LKSILFATAWSVEKVRSLLGNQLDNGEVDRCLGVVVEGVDVGASPDQDLAAFLFFFNRSGSWESDDVKRGVTVIISSVGISLELDQNFQAFKISTLRWKFNKTCIKKLGNWTNFIWNLNKDLPAFFATVSVSQSQFASK